MVSPDQSRHIERPEGLSDSAWAALEACRNRLERAERDEDWPLVVGSAKELVETIAKVVLDERGETVASGAELPSLISRAHVALERQPGRGLAAEPPVRNIAQGARTIAQQLPELRNRYGTGHGRASTPELAEELVSLSVDAAMLWARWALRRLGHLISGWPIGLARDLRSAIFYRGSLAQRLEDAGLPHLTVADQHLIGLAVAHRAMQNTYVVIEDGVDACVRSPDLDVWPAGYRAGLAEGLFLDRDGYVDVKAWGARSAIAALIPHPEAADVVRRLAATIAQASRSYDFLEDHQERARVVAAIVEDTAVLPAAELPNRWRDVAALLEPGDVAEG